MRWWVLLLGLATTNAFGWGDQGHRVIGYIAASQLTDGSRARIVAILGNDELAQISTWMDDERDRLADRIPGSSRWHYENRWTCHATNARACEASNCVTAQIERYRIVLSNPNAARETRAEALRILVHLVGDLHQPLHLADNHDRGGNDTFVLVPGERDARRLHEVWDSVFVRMNLARRAPAKYAGVLQATISSPPPVDSRPVDSRSVDSRSVATHSIETWANVTSAIETWAAESFRLGEQVAYGALPGFSCGSRASSPIQLDTEYVTRSRAVVADQLRLAGLHLAQLLNASLDSKCILNGSAPPAVVLVADADDREGACPP